MAVNWCTLVGSDVARLRLSRPGSSSAGVGGSSSSQEEICVVLSLTVENDVGGDVAMVTCTAVEVVGFAKTVLICCCLANLGKEEISR